MLYQTIILAIVLLITDRALKYVAVIYNGLFVIGNKVSIGFELVKNKGMGLSINLPAWTSISLTIIFLGCLSWFLYQQIKCHKKINQRQIIAFVLIIAGGLSNLIDRLFYGYVIDYSVIYTQSQTFAFNLADVMVVVGVAMLGAGFLLARLQVGGSASQRNTRHQKNTYTPNSILSLNEATYNKIATRFSQTREKPLWPEVRQFKQYVNSSDKILDIGCGSGRLVRLFDGMSVDYTGIDTSAKLLEQAQRNVKCPPFAKASWGRQMPNAKNSRLNVKFVKSNMLELDFMDNSFDAVFMIASLHHLPTIYHHQALREAYRVLTQGRHLLITNFNLWKFSWKDKTVWRYKKFSKNVITSWNKHPLYYYAFTLRELKRKTQKAGFKIIHAYYAKAGQRARFYNGHNLVLILKK
jgi:signal peptidase II